MVKEKLQCPLAIYNQVSFFHGVFILQVFRYQQGHFLNKEMACRTCSKDAKSKFPTEQDLTKAWQRKLTGIQLLNGKWTSMLLKKHKKIKIISELHIFNNHACN